MIEKGEHFTDCKIYIDGVEFDAGVVTDFRFMPLPEPRNHEIWVDNLREHFENEQLQNSMHAITVVHPIDTIPDLGANWYHITPSGRWYRCHYCKRLFPHSDYRMFTKNRHFSNECLPVIRKHKGPFPF